LNPLLVLDLIFHAIAFAFDKDGFRVMQQPVQDRGGQSAVVIKDLRPVFKCAVGSDYLGPLLIALADDLEENIGTAVGRGTSVPFFYLTALLVVTAMMPIALETSVKHFYLQPSINKQPLALL
jgi:hypothetical protein